MKMRHFSTYRAWQRNASFKRKARGNTKPTEREAILERRLSIFAAFQKSQQK